LIVFAACSAALCSHAAAPALPRTPRRRTKDVMKLGWAVATMAALVLGLLIASAKSSYEGQRSGFDRWRPT